MQRVTFSVLFYVKRSKPFKNGDLPIYLRITIDGKKAETSLKRGVPPELWDNVRHRAKGQSTEAKQINQELDSVSGQLHNHKLEFQEHGKTLTAQALLNAYLGKGDQQITLCFIPHGGHFGQELEGPEGATHPPRSQLWPWSAATH